MSKSILAAAVAEKTGLNKTQSAEAVDAVIETITAAVAKGERFAITGFLTFDVKDQAAKEVRNPATGAAVKVPAKKVVKVKVGATLKDAPNKK